MKQLALILAIIIFPVFQNMNDEVKLYTYWKKGDTQKITIREGFINYEGSKITKQDVTISNVNITVLEESDSSYVIEWNYIDTKEERLNVEIEEEDEIDKRIDEMFDKVKLIYETDEFGEFKKMLNLDELIKAVGDSLDVLIKEEMQDLGEDSEMFVEVMKEMFNSEPMRDEIVRDVLNYHYYLGRVFTADTLINYTDELENKLGGDKIPLIGTVTIKTDHELKTIEINDLKEIDEEKTKDVINDAAKKLKAKKRKKLKKELNTNQFKIEDIENYKYDFEYGWLKSYERNRIYKTGDNRIERFIKIEEQN